MKLNRFASILGSQLPLRLWGKTVIDTSNIAYPILDRYFIEERNKGSGSKFIIKCGKGQFLVKRLMYSFEIMNMCIEPREVVTPYDDLKDNQPMEKMKKELNEFLLECIVDFDHIVKISLNSRFYNICDVIYLGVGNSNAPMIVTTGDVNWLLTYCNLSEAYVFSRPQDRQINLGD